MNLTEITEENTPTPGEYLFYEPARTMVLCGGVVKEKNIIRALNGGTYIEAPVEHFKKIQLTRQEQQRREFGRCKGCGG